MGSVEAGIARLLTRQGLIVALAAILSPGCTVRYLAGAAYHEAELLLAREPVDRVLATRALSAGQEQRLRLIPELKAYGKALGLSSTENYSAVSLDWNRTIWNVSACDPLSFTPRTWGFPIVGRVPYLGYFTDAAAEAQVARLKAEGLDVYKRTAGAFSTLGWFRDPVLPTMLRWSEADLAETVFHELAHATLWVPGSVSFNESFASVVGEASARRWLIDRYGPDAPQVAEYDREDRDWRRFEAILHELYKDLDSVYTDPALSPEEKAARKATLLAGLADRVRSSPIENQDAYLRVATRNPWNNARLVQFKAYNSNDELFARVFDQHPGDVRAFIDTIATITKGRRDPFVALHDAVGVKNP